MLFCHVKNAFYALPEQKSRIMRKNITIYCSVDIFNGSMRVLLAQNNTTSKHRSITDFYVSRVKNRNYFNQIFTINVQKRRLILFNHPFIPYPLRPHQAPHQANTPRQNPLSTKQLLLHPAHTEKTLTHSPLNVPQPLNPHNRCDALLLESALPQTPPITNTKSAEILLSALF